MIETLKHEQVSLVDGIMVAVDETRWVQILPDADDPVFHLYAEGEESEDAAALIETYGRRLEAIIEERGSADE
jgi:mannose-1-phosphate guanylyltransferase/phosphomannomutase